MNKHGLISQTQHINQEEYMYLRIYLQIFTVGVGVTNSYSWDKQLMNHCADEKSMLKLKKCCMFLCLVAHRPISLKEQNTHTDPLI